MLEGTCTYQYILLVMLFDGIHTNVFVMVMLFDSTYQYIYNGDVETKITM